MSLWTAEEAAAATGGRVSGDWVASGVSIDTRSLAEGDLFVALKDVRDGHDFVADALTKGAAAALVSHVPDGVDPAKLLIVDDVLPGLERLGAAARARSAAKVIGVTGSVGKTSTKEMLRAALGHLGKIHAAEKSYNNHWGVPLTLARMPRDTDIAVIEIGMNAPGEIAPLARLTRPHVVVITTVTAAHLEAFDNIEGIAREKASICEGLEPDGIALFHGDIQTLPILRTAADKAGARVETFGQSDGVTHQVTDIRLSRETTIAKGRLAGQEILYKVRSPGRHFAINAMGVLGVARAVGGDPALAISALGQWDPVAGRGTIEYLVLDPVEQDVFIELIDDAFNANPASMEAALEVLAAVDPRDGVGRIRGGRRIAILGDMLELGPGEEAMHAAIADLPAMQALDRVHCVGPRMKALYDRLAANQRGEWAERAEDLTHQARTLIDAGDVVLVKGSKGIRVSLIVDAIRKLGHARATENEDRG